MREAQPISEQAANGYMRPALAFLALTLLAGVWLRGSLLHAPLTLGLPFRNMVHAHSHVAFFGWVTMLLFGALLRDHSPLAQATSWYRSHSMILTVASAAAFIAFLEGGYGPAAIVVSVIHVALWFAFAVRTWRAADSWAWRSALAYLCVAGAATFAPLFVLLRGASDAWWSEFAVKLFLIPFLNGWVTLGVFAAVGSAAGYRYGAAARVLVAAGALPSTLLFIASPPPLPVLLLIGRAGTALVGLGSVAFALGLWRRGALHNAWLHLGVAALALKGGIELLAAAGVGAALMRSPPIVLAHLHLVLLVFVSASLIGSVLRVRALLPALTFAVGAGLMLAALVVSGWAQLYLWLNARTGIDLVLLLWLALLGGVLAAGGGAAAIASALRTRPAAVPEPIVASS